MLSAIFSVRDVEISMDYYINKLGFTSGRTLPGPDGKPDFGSASLGEQAHFMFNGSSDPFFDDAARGRGVEMHIELPPQYDINALYAEFQQQGATIVRALQDEFWGERRFVITDPDGYRISFNQAITEVDDDEETAELISQS